MKYITVTLALLQLVATTVATYAASCNQNNCARAVTGTRFPPETRVERMEDCSSFFSFTVSPAPTTTTVTVTATAEPVPTTVATITTYIPKTISTKYRVVTVSTVTLKRWWKRDEYAYGAVTVSPTYVPPYASPCSGTVGYSSICSCWGIEKTTITLPTPTSTVTETVTETPVENVTAITTAITKIIVTKTKPVTATTVVKVPRNPCKTLPPYWARLCYKTYGYPPSPPSGYY